MPLTQDLANALAIATKICQRFEGCVLTAYHGAADRAGLYTIGWGTISIDGEPVQPGMTITQEQADEYFQNDLSAVQSSVEDMLTTDVKDHQEAALISFAYNLGAAALRSSTLLKLVNAGDFEAAAGQFKLWVHANGQVVAGLVARRAYEARVFQGTLDA